MKMSSRAVVSHVPYSVNQCALDIVATEEMEPHSKGALVSAAKKRLKAHIALNWLIYIAYKQDLDMTPGLANHIVKGWIGRSISRSLLKKLFSVSSRSAGDKSIDAQKVDEVVVSYRDNVLRDMNNSLIEVESEAALLLHR